QDITVELDANGEVTITTADVDGGSFDNCTAAADLVLQININEFDCSNVGDNNVTLTVTDEAGNVNTCVATVTVEDNLAPTFTCPDPQTVSGCDDLVPDVVQFVTDAADN
ncbi:hypothetical protein RZS08_38970, partial [Arthrospira platensis SPKY1]|nr:hypothetical protein [Arthrospira platensis SPKY1]